MLIVDAHFLNSYKPNEKQGPKTHQEDWRARKVQRKKCKGKRSTAKCRYTTNYKSAVEYKSAIEYRSVIEYNSSAEWLWQIKVNWAQDPSDPVNIIWPINAQILLYEKIGVKTNMKKHDEKK